ncbi:hypothetical protein, partial [Burkholderia pseudomallei]|uniref:hypothetical protein n=1 Tax=Burkholderia pseudomallei TaxID=28450 RepID=UPI001A8FD2EC
MNLFINLTYFSVRLLILSLAIRKSPAPSSAHTYRLFIVKEHIREKIRLLTAPFSAALRCQQQRN